MKKRFTLLGIILLLSACVQTNSSSFNSISSEQIISLSSETISSISSENSSLESLANSESTSSVSSRVEEKDIVLDFYNFNDFHGSIEENSSLGEPGISKLSAYLKQQKNNNPDGFVLTSSGDMWQGSALSNTFKGAIVNDWMNYIRFDCMTLGNHEFDWGVDRIKSNMQEMNFPVISCNIEDKDLAKPVDWIEGTAMKEVQGLKIGFVGAIGEGQTSDILASISYSLNFPDPYDYSVKAIDKLREQGADLIVYLLHDSYETVLRSLASKVDVIFCGHTHQGERKMVSGKPALQAYSNGKDISHVKLTYNTATKKVTYNTYEIVDVRYLDVTPDAGTEELIQKRYTPEIKAKLTAQVGRLSKQLSQNDLTKLITKYLYKYCQDTYTEYPIFAANHNNARSAMASGVVTYKDVFKSFPFENEMVVMKVKGDALKTITYGTWYPENQSINSNNYYYIFTIDYIADYDYYYSPELNVEIVRRYTDLYPRDIFARYFGVDYPL